MLGLGVSHGPLIGDAYAKPLAKMVEYLDQLEALRVPKERTCLAAIAPRMLDLARERTAGSHPYLMPPEHTAVARERLGPDALLAPELGVVLDSDSVTARATALAALSHYFRFPNYVNNWRRLGYSEEDVQGSDRLVDAVIAWGDVKQIAGRVKAHLDAGADHVCLQVLRPAGGQPQPLPVAEWRELAGALL
jgi:probable F420-dependent oxidoreductase